jgi:excisionase family DNA binding protein
VALNRAKWLRNGWVEIRSVTAGGRRGKVSIGPTGWATVEQAAAILDVSEMTVRRLLKRGALVFELVGSSTVINVRELRRYRKKVAA